MEETNIHDLLAILKRRKLAFFATAAGVFILAALLSLSWSSYRSTATVQIEQPDIPSTVTSPQGMSQSEAMRALADQRIQQIQQRITSTANLIEVITKYDLYAKPRQTKPMTDIVEAMRKKIRLELLSASLSSSGGGQKSDQLSAIAFTLGFTYNDPLKTQQVTNELMSRFLNEDLKQRRNQTQSTSAFLEAQLKALETSMVEQEKRIAEFRAQHPDNRPEALALNQQLMASTFQNILAVEAQMTAVDKTRGDIRVQMASVDPYSRVIADGQMMTTPTIQLKALQARYSSSVALYSADHPDVVRLRHQIEALQKEMGQTDDSAQLQSQIDDTRTNLAAAVATYGPDHPDVQALRHHLTALEDRMANQARDPSSHSTVKRDADNPTYLMMTGQLQAAEQQYRALSSQHDNLQQQYARYQANVAQTPAIEQQFATLSRDYDNAQLRYREMKEKKLTADMNEQMDQGRMAERLQVIDPPELPSDTSPKRFLLLVGGFALALCCGLGAVALREMLSQSIHGPRHLMSLTGGVAPLVVIPHIFTRNERQTVQYRRLKIGAATVCLLIIVSLVFNQFIMPLDVMSSVVARRLGLS